jgi:hypothetical protein
MNLQNDQVMIKPKHILMTGLTIVGTYTFYQLFLVLQKFYHVYKIVANLKNNKESAKIYNHHIEIPYTHLNTPYIVRLPFNPKLAAKMSQCQMKAKIDGREYDITQQEGLPYLISADDLGADYMMLYNDMTEEEIVYDDDKIPYYLEFE